MSKIRYVTEHGEAKSMATEQLLDIASNYCNDRLGAIEELEKKVSTLQAVVAALIDHLGISTEEVLEIFGIGYHYKVDKLKDERKTSTESRGHG